MSLDLHLVEDGEEIYSCNLTYDYSGMWALAMGALGREHDPPRSFLHPEPDGRIRLVEIEGLTGADSLNILRPCAEAMANDMDAYRALNPDNGWGDADLFLKHLTRCTVVASEYPDAVWRAYR